MVVLWLMFRRRLVATPATDDEQEGLDASHALVQRGAALRVLGVLAATVNLFLFQGMLRVSPAFIAPGAAAVALALVRANVQEVLVRVDWSVLLFFAGLFVMVGGLDSSGALGRIAEAMSRGAGLPPVLLGVGLIWAVAVLSAVVDNIPITIALIPVIADLRRFGIDVQPLWWALAFGAGLGGNATIIGATTNIVMVGALERSGSQLSASQWMRWAVPATLATCSAASIMYVVLFPLLRQ